MLENLYDQAIIDNRSRFLVTGIGDGRLLEEIRRGFWESPETHLNPFFVNVLQTLTTTKIQETVSDNTAGFQSSQEET